jgi:molybdate-binding protein
MQGEVCVLLTGPRAAQGKGDEAERHLEAARQVDPTAADAVMALRRKAHLVP